MPLINNAGIDVGSLGARDLKSLIASAGLEFHDCIELSELRVRAHQAIALGARADQPVAGEVQSDNVACKARMQQDAQHSKVIRLPRFLSDDEIQQIHSLAAVSEETCRPSQAARNRSGMWDTLYLSASGTFRKALPELCQKLITAAIRVDAETPGWGVLQGAKGAVVPRVVEYHTVRTHGSLPWVHHCDEGSLLTIDVMLCDTNDFEGGKFQTLEADGHLMQHTFERGDVQIFQSHKYHCVEPVRRGKRVVLVIELWDGEERRCAHRCERRAGVCEEEARTSASA